MKSCIHIQFYLRRSHDFTFGNVYFRKGLKFLNRMVREDLTGRWYLDKNWRRFETSNLVIWGKNVLSREKSKSEGYKRDANSEEKKVTSIAHSVGFLEWTRNQLYVDWGYRCPEYMQFKWGHNACWGDIAVGITDPPGTQGQDFPTDMTMNV